MNQQQWHDVDQFITTRFIPDDPVLQEALAASAAAGLPAIHVSPAQGKLLYLLARAMGARRILEIGTLGGYSTIWLGRALPADGRLVTLEMEAKHAAVAAANLARAGLAQVVQIRLGPALDTLRELVAAGDDPFDLIFIDADKPGYADYLTWSLKLARRGSLIIADNVVRQGAILHEGSADANVQGIHRFYERVTAVSGLEVTVLQTVGSKGYDGMLLAVVTA